MKKQLFRNSPDIAFEEALAADDDLGVRERSFSRIPFFVGISLVVIFCIVVVGKIFSIGFLNFEFYTTRARANASALTRIEAPRGIIEDRYGVILADNRTSFSLSLDVHSFLEYPDRQDEILSAVFQVVGITADNVLSLLQSQQREGISDVLPLVDDLSDDQIVRLNALSQSIPSLIVRKQYKRFYPNGSIFSSVVGYTSLATADDLKNNNRLTSSDTVGRSGVESFYDDMLRGQSGTTVAVRNAQGNILEQYSQIDPVTGGTIRTTIDAELQTVFYNALAKRLGQIGRTNGVGLALNPHTGEVLAMVSFPVFDNNLFTSSAHKDSIQALLRDKNKPLFNRAISGVYNPGSTIKPLVAVAALSEKVVTPTQEFFSPGYLEIPNPYHPDKPSRFLDWRFQGSVNVYSALAQSSNVYFYIVGGGARGISGLGISRLKSWWEKFGLGVVSGIDLPGERSGFLPDPEWKKRTRSAEWLLGDTYNVSIGQGDLLLTPVQLVQYTQALANGGKILRPHIVSRDGTISVTKDLSEYKDAFSEIQKGMRLTVTSPKGTAYILHDLPMEVAAKTGSAQILNNTQENAFFIGYAPYDKPTIAIMILVENSKEGSLNAVPVAREVFEWYYEHRVR